MISPQLTMAVAQTRIDDLRRAANARGTAEDETRPARPVVSEQSVTLRLGSADDANSLARLAALDGAEPPEQPVLLAEVDGVLLAALALSDRSAIADPVRPTAHLIELLCARARQLDGQSRRRGYARRRPSSRPCRPSPGTRIGPTTGAIEASPIRTGATATPR
jgi:hypothetical protein